MEISLTEAMRWAGLPSKESYKMSEEVAYILEILLWNETEAVVHEVRRRTT